ncbi:MAG: hypothetical protein H6715_02570 [Myxococcales bacterium]|nr:hypothetical protein [Myxococcales bacterium]
MRFIDEVTIDVRGGKGGDGSRAMRREKFVPLGGPAGGNGGEGGDVVLVADPQLRTLLDLHYRRSLQAESGEHGRGKDQHGKGGRDLDVRVPLGTQIFEATDGVLLADLDIEGARFIAAHGGKGGYGNKHFVTPYDRAPLTAEKKDILANARTLRLEPAGFAGRRPGQGFQTWAEHPNSSVSQARPKIAEYPHASVPVRACLGLMTEVLVRQIFRHHRGAHKALGSVCGSSSISNAPKCWCMYLRWTRMRAGNRCAISIS